MTECFDKIVTDERLAWNKTLIDQREKFFVKLNLEVIQELTQKRNELDSLSTEELPLLKKQILSFKKEILLDGVGLFIIDGTSLEIFSLKEKTTIYKLISKNLGDLIVQNIHQEKIVKIKDVGKSMKTGGRYHQTKEGGSFHTDSPQWKNVPDFIGLLCIRPAKIGGESKFVSSYTVHNQLIKLNPNFLQSLYKNFHFDKRNEFKKNESPTTFKPIFKYENNELKFRYLRNYIDDGQKLVNQPLTNDYEGA